MKEELLGSHRIEAYGVNRNSGKDEVHKRYMITYEYEWALRGMVVLAINLKMKEELQHRVD